MSQRRPTLLAVLIGRDEQTHEEVVAGFERCARDLDEDATLSVRTLRRWITGDVRTAPRPSQRRVARRFWGFPMSALLAPAPVNIPPSDRTGAAIAMDAALTDVLHGGQVGTLQVDDEPRGGPVSILERQAAMATRRAARFAIIAEVDNVGPEAIVQLQDEVCYLANTLLREPLITVMSDLTDTQEIVFRLLEGRQRPALTRDLYLLAGMVCGMLSKVSHDLGRSHEAMTHARTLYVCADNAGHTALKAWARGQQALIAFRAGRTQESARYASSGLEVADGQTGTVTAWLPALQARALAHMGVSDEARAALTHAVDRIDNGSADELDRVGGIFTFGPAKGHYYAAGAYVYLDADADAEREALTAIDLFERGPDDQRSFASEAGARAELALARVHSGQIDGASLALQPVLDLGPERRIGGILHSLGQVHQALRRPTYSGSQIARDLCDQIEAFGRTPAAAISM